MSQETTCAYYRQDVEPSRCPREIEYDVRFFYPGDRGKPHRTRCCAKHLGKIVEMKFHNNATTVKINKRGVLDESILDEYDDHDPS